MECITTEQASSVLQRYYVQLISTLSQHLNELLPYFVPEGVITIDVKNTIKQFGSTPSDRAEYLLDNHINRLLAGGIVTNFIKLLKVMQKIAGCNSLAGEVWKALNCVTPLDTPISVVNKTTVDVTALQGNESYTMHNYRAHACMHGSRCQTL